MRGRPSSLLAVVSLLACLATVGLWVRSLNLADNIGYIIYNPNGPQPIYRRFDLYTGIHCVVVGRQVLTRMSLCPYAGTPMPRHGPFFWSSWPPSFSYLLPTTYSFVEHSGVDGETTWFEVPYWLLLVTFSVSPVIVLARWLRRVYPRPGFCIKCGYDLRATPNRCPECGTPAPNKLPIT